MEQLIKAEYDKLMGSCSSLHNLTLAVEREYAGDHRYVNTINSLQNASAAINKALVILDQVGFDSQKTSLVGPMIRLDQSQPAKEDVPPAEDLLARVVADWPRLEARMRGRIRRELFHEDEERCKCGGVPKEGYDCCSDCLKSSRDLYESFKEAKAASVDTAENL